MSFSWNIIPERIIAEQQIILLDSSNKFLKLLDKKFACLIKLLELDENYKYMIRFNDLNKKSIDTKSKIIKLSKNYDL